MDYPGLALEFMEKMYLLRQAKPHRQMNKSMHGECFVLQYIAHQQGVVVPGEIRDIMGISSARIAAALNNLERKGLVNRDIDPRDRRRVLVSLTPQGEEMAKMHNRELYEKTVEMLQLLGEEDATTYVRITGRLAELAAQMKETETVEAEETTETEKIEK
ncbi:MAG TPA: winged helix DNA-binding protein [Clostridiales bacterium]|nr:winged helix DNA-binding protein [Clostridiales bacterium]